MAGAELTPQPAKAEDSAEIRPTCNQCGMLRQQFRRAFNEGASAVCADAAVTVPLLFAEKPEAGHAKPTD